MSSPLIRVMIIAMTTTNGGNKADNTPGRYQVNLGSYKYNQPLPPLCQSDTSPTSTRAVQHRSEPKLVQIGPTSPNERLHRPKHPTRKHLNSPERSFFRLAPSKCTFTPECLIEHIYFIFYPSIEDKVPSRAEGYTSAPIPSSWYVFCICVFHFITPLSYTR